MMTVLDILRRCGAGVWSVLSSLGALSGRQAVAVGLLAVIASAAGYGLRGCERPASPRGDGIDTVYVGRELAPRDTTGGAVPDARIVYRRTTDTVRVSVVAPRTLGPIDLVSTGRPVQTGRSRCTLTRYDVSERRYVQDVYDTLDRHLIGPRAYAVATPRTRLAVGTLSYTRRGRLFGGLWSASAGVGVAMSTRGAEPALTTSLSLRW